MKRLSKIFPLLIIVFCAVALVILTQDPTQNVGESERSTYINVNVMGQDCGINVSYDNPEHEVYTLTSEVPVQVAVSEFSGIFVKINGVPFLSGEGKELLIERLAEDSYIHIECFDLQNNPIGEAKIKTLPSDIPDWDLDYGAQENNQDVFYVALGTSVYKLDGLGNILFYRDCGMNVSDFRSHEFNGKKFYSFYVEAGETTGVQVTNSVGEKRLARMVLNEKYLLNDWIEYMSPSETVPEFQPIEENFVMLGERHYLISAHIGKRVNNIPEEIPHSDMGSRVAAVVLQEIKDGQLVFEWDSTDYPELYRYSTEDFYNRETIWCNYAALTSISLDEVDGNLLCFFQNCASVLKIERTTGNVLWHVKVDAMDSWDNILYASVNEKRWLTLVCNTDGVLAFVDYNLSDLGTILESKQYIGETLPVCKMNSLQRLSDGCYVVTWELDKQSMLTEIDAAEMTINFELFSDEEFSGAYKESRF